MIDYDDLIDDLHESAAQSYDELSQATIDVLNRAVEAIEGLRGEVREAELEVYERLRRSASTPYSFYPYLDSCIRTRKQARESSHPDA